MLLVKVKIFWSGGSKIDCVFDYRKPLTEIWAAAAGEVEYAETPRFETSRDEPG
jgi:hypothetical protein